MKTLCESAPIDLDVNDSMYVAIKQILWFKANGFGLKTVRALVFLPAKPGATWDETCEEMAMIWESLRGHDVAEEAKG
jgi:hypothetical protein